MQTKALSCLFHNWPVTSAGFDPTTLPICWFCEFRPKNLLRREYLRSAEAVCSTARKWLIVRTVWDYFCPDLLLFGIPVQWPWITWCFDSERVSAQIYRNPVSDSHGFLERTWLCKGLYLYLQCICEVQLKLNILESLELPMSESNVKIPDSFVSLSGLELTFLTPWEDGCLWGEKKHQFYLSTEWGASPWDRILEVLNGKALFCFGLSLVFFVVVGFPEKTASQSHKGRLSDDIVGHLEGCLWSFLPVCLVLNTMKKRVAHLKEGACTKAKDRDRGEVEGQPKSRCCSQWVNLSNRKQNTSRLHNTCRSVDWN